MYKYWLGLSYCGIIHEKENLRGIVGLYKHYKEKFGKVYLYRQKRIGKYLSNIIEMRKNSGWITVWKGE